MSRRSALLVALGFVLGYATWAFVNISMVYIDWGLRGVVQPLNMVEVVFFVSFCVVVTVVAIAERWDPPSTAGGDSS